MKIEIFVVCIFLFLQISKAQVVSGPYLYMSSDSYKPPRGYDAEGDLMYSGDLIFQANMVYKKPLFSFQQFSQDLKLQKENAVDFQDKLKGDFRFINTITLKNRNYFFIRDISNKASETTYGMEFFPDKLNVSDPITICKSSGRIVGKPSFILSNDKSKFLYRYKTLDSLEKRENTLGKETIGLILFDENLKRIWGGEFEMPEPQVKMQILDMTLSDDGNVYILTGVGRIDKFLTLTAAKFDYLKVLQIKEVEMSEGPEINAEAYKVNLIGGKIVESPLHEIVVVGTYAKEGKTQRYFEYVKGIFATKIDNQKVISNFDRYDITMNIMKDQATARELRELEKFSEDAIGFLRLEVLKVFFMPDGSTKVILDENGGVDPASYITTSQYNPNHMATHSSPYTTTTTMTSPTTCSSGDGLIFSIAADKSLAWISKIRKNQIELGVNGYTLSVNAIVKDNDLHVFYVNHEKSGELQILKYNPQGTILSTPLSVKHGKSIPIKIMLKSNGLNLIGNDKNIHKNHLYTIVIN